MSALLFSYRDVDMYERDAALFNDGQWLNDSCISYCFRRIEDHISSSNQEMLKSILLVDPSVVSFLRTQCEEDEEFEDLRISLESDTKAWILLPVSDSQSFDTPSSHWSTLLCHRPTMSLLHYDSLGGRNLGSAQQLAGQVAKLLSWSKTPSVAGYEGPQQQNGSDCGVFALLFCRYVCDRLCQQRRNPSGNNSASDSGPESGSAPVSLQVLTWLSDLPSNLNPVAAAEFRRAMRADVIQAKQRFGQKRTNDLLESIRLSGSGGSTDSGFQGVEFRFVPEQSVMGSIPETGEDGDDGEVDEYGLDYLPEGV